MLRIDAFTGRAGPIHECEEHAATFVSGEQCPASRLDRQLASSVAVRAAYAFGDWPPKGCPRCLHPLHPGRPCSELALRAAWGDQ